MFLTDLKNYKTSFRVVLLALNVMKKERLQTWGVNTGTERYL
jgi:hypothetical protein